MPNDPVLSPHRVRACALLFLPGLLALLVPPTPLHAARPYTIEFAGGAVIPFESTQRDDYGTGAAFGLGATSQITPSGAWLVFDIGLIRNRGQEFSADPTFELEDSTLWMVPLRVGIRRDLAPVSYVGFPRIYAGVALQSMLLYASVPLVETSSNASFGLSFELRADLIGTEKWRLWARQNLSFTSEVQLSETLRSIDPSGAQFQLGIGYTLP